MGTPRIRSILHAWRHATTPIHPETSIDFRTMQPSPDVLLRPDGSYRGGWFDSFTGTLQTQCAKVGSKRFHRWLHLHINTPDWFIACNLVDLSLGSNTSILALNTKTGECVHQTQTGVLWNHSIDVSDMADEAWDRANGSTIRIDLEHNHIAFDLCVQGMRLNGTARCVYERPFVQSTPTLPLHGSLQWWGNMRIESASLTLREGAHPIEIPPNSLGGYDRTIGHRRPIQNWNWLAVIGHATRERDGARVEISMLSATDQDGARPKVRADKNNIWVDGAYTKLKELTFDTLLLDPETRNTAPWHLTCTDPDGSFVDLVFTPRSHRREKRSVPLVFDVDFNQYYGTLSGTLCVQGERFLLSNVFALVEDSLMVM